MALAEDADLCEALQSRKGIKYQATTLKDGRRKVMLYMKKPKDERKRTPPDRRIGNAERKRRSRIDHGF
ncbi:MAG: hypothetical protein EA379_00255 [Phycisphaerales bacterium]|nr:MAG: hypothetical protein EA379_00255 [Phycisphaerales bacterium]